MLEYVDKTHYPNEEEYRQTYGDHSYKGLYESAKKHSELNKYGEYRDSKTKGVLFTVHTWSVPGPYYQYDGKVVDSGREVTPHFYIPQEVTAGEVLDEMLKTGEHRNRAIKSVIKRKKEEENVRIRLRIEECKAKVREELRRRNQDPVWPLIRSTSKNLVKAGKKDEARVLIQRYLKIQSKSK